MLAGTPIGVRPAPDAQEDGVDRIRPGAAPGVSEGHAREPVAVLVQFGQPRLEPDVDQRMLLDPLDQIRRHRLAEPVAPHEHRHVSPVVREVEDGLAGRVAGPHHDHALA